MFLPCLGGGGQLSPNQKSKVKRLRFSPEDSITAGRWCPVQSSTFCDVLKNEIDRTPPSWADSAKSSLDVRRCATWRHGSGGAVGRDDAVAGLVGLGTQAEVAPGQKEDTRGFWLKLM